MSPAVSPIDVYERALADADRGLGGQGYRAHADDGSPVPFTPARWVGDVTRTDELLLAGARGPVLDIGCGPGRHLQALRRRGITGLGIDVSAAAVAAARRRGARAVQCDVFAAVPAAGTWQTALLLDGNVGIGGDPAALLRRIAGLLAPDGTVIVEVEPDGLGLRPLQVRLEGPGCAVSRWFPWARVGADAIAGLAAEAGLGVVEAWHLGPRRGAALAPVPSRACPHTPMTSISAV